MSRSDQIAALFAILRDPSTVLRLRQLRAQFRGSERSERLFYVYEMLRAGPKAYEEACCACAAPDDVDTVTGQPIWLYEFATATELVEYVKSGMGAASQSEVLAAAGAE